MSKMSPYQTFQSVVREELCSFEYASEHFGYLEPHERHELREYVCNTVLDAYEGYAGETIANKANLAPDLIEAHSAGRALLDLFFVKIRSLKLGYVLPNS